MRGTRVDDSAQQQTAPSDAHFAAGVTRLRDRRFVMVRVSGIFTLAGLIVALPLDSPLRLRVLVAAYLVFVLTPVGIVNWRLAGPGRVDGNEMMLDVASASVIAFLAPGFWWPALLIAAMTVVSAIPVQPRKLIVVVIAAVAISFTVSGITAGRDYWYANVLAFLLLAMCIDAYYGSRQRHLQAATDRHNALIGATPVFIWELDRTTGQFAAVAGNTFALLGYHPHDLIGMHWTTVVAGPDREPFFAAIRNTVPGEVSIVGRLCQRDGTPTTFRNVITNDGSKNIVHGVSSDIEEVATANRQLAHQASHDELTGLPNRAALKDRMGLALERATTESPVALLMLDLDRFKDINDTLGHSVGDQLLQILATRLAAALPHANTVARLGGDEFAILIADGITHDTIEETTALIVDATKVPSTVNGVSLATPASIGIVLAPEHGSTTDELLKRADIAMYQAKRSAAAVKLFENTPEDLNLDRLTLGAALGGALDEEQFELWYQPQIDLRTRRIVGAEGLARWRHPERGILGPDQFLELMSLSGEFSRFTDLVIRDGIETAALCRDAGAEVTIAVNLASSSFFDQKLPARIHALLDLHKVRPDQLILEITESDILEEAGSSVTVFGRLAKLGIGLAIDDFGTGHSSLSRLRALPVTELKIDGSFIRSIDSPEDRIIVMAIINLALLLGHRTVAEGVEDQHTADLLLEFGCERGQGYSWAEPMPREEFLELLHTWPDGAGGRFESVAHADTEGARRG